MSENRAHRKTIRHYHEPGDLHELTFSRYRRQSLLTNDAWRKRLSGHVEPSPMVSDFTGRSLNDVERHHIIDTLALTDGNRSEAAKILGIGERTLYRKLKEYDL